MLLVEVLQEVVAFLELVDVHTLLVTNRLMCELSILPLATMRISQFDDAVIASYNDSLTLFNLENGIVQSGSITVHKENAGDVLRIVFRNSTIKRLLVRDFNFCKNNDRSSCCVFDEIGGAADTFVITMELGLFDHCFDNTEELVTFVRRFRSINVSPTGKARSDFGIEVCCRQEHTPQPSAT